MLTIKMHRDLHFLAVQDVNCHLLKANNQCIFSYMFRPSDAYVMCYICKVSDFIDCEKNVEEPSFKLDEKANSPMKILTHMGGDFDVVGVRN